MPKIVGVHGIGQQYEGEEGLNASDVKDPWEEEMLAAWWCEVARNPAPMSTASRTMTKEPPERTGSANRAV